MTVRAPSLVFGLLWLVWYGSVLAALFRPDDPAFGLWVLLAFFPIEGAALVVDTGKHDTLSELQTWVNRTLSRPGVGIARGWNAMLLILVLLLATLLGRTMQAYTGSWPLAWTVAALTVIWLYDHWRAPERFG